MDENIVTKKVMLSGIQPSGDLHLGNYLGAIKNWVARTDEFDNYYFMADIAHHHRAAGARRPAPAHPHPAGPVHCLWPGPGEEHPVHPVPGPRPPPSWAGWLNCYTMFGELSRMTQFKDKSAKHADNINGGLFTYPSLMAADILLYQPDYVPVGNDQKQHVELTRNVAQRFNGIYGEVFKIPEPYIPKAGARVMSLHDPDSKMSK